MTREETNRVRVGSVQVNGEGGENDQHEECQLD